MLSEGEEGSFRSGAASGIEWLSGGGVSTSRPESGPGDRHGRVVGWLVGWWVGGLVARESFVLHYLAGKQNEGRLDGVKGSLGRKLAF